jgi:hypothetical protein
LGLSLFSATNVQKSSRLLNDRFKPSCGLRNLLFAAGFAQEIGMRPAPWPRFFDLAKRPGAGSRQAHQAALHLTAWDRGGAPIALHARSQSIGARAVASALSAS